MSICSSRARHRLVAWYGLLSCPATFGRPERPWRTFKTRPSLLFTSRRYRTIMSQRPDNNNQLREGARSVWSDLNWTSYESYSGSFASATHLATIDHSMVSFVFFSQWSKGSQVNFPTLSFKSSISSSLHFFIVQNLVAVTQGKAINLFLVHHRLSNLCSCWAVIHFSLFLCPVDAHYSSPHHQQQGQVDTSSHPIHRYPIKRFALLFSLSLTPHTILHCPELPHMCHFFPQTRIRATHNPEGKGWEKNKGKKKYTSKPKIQYGTAIVVSVEPANQPQREKWKGQGRGDGLMVLPWGPARW